MKLPFKAFAVAGTLLFLLSLAVPAPLFADGVDYQEFQEDPLETAIRKLASPGDIEWDKEEMISGGAPDFIKDMKWPLKSCTFSRGFSRKRRRHTGVDLLAPKGTPVLAVLDGVVEVVSNAGRDSVDTARSSSSTITASFGPSIRIIHPTTSRSASGSNRAT